MTKRIKDPIPPFYTVLPREIREATKWALRAALIPAGYSPMAEQLVSRAENGLLHLKCCLEQHEGKPIQQPQCLTDNKTEVVIDVQQQNLLLVGPAVFDLTIARTAQFGRCLTHIRNIGNGSPFLDELVIYHASHGHPLMLMRGDSEAQHRSRLAIPAEQASFTRPQWPTIYIGNGDILGNIDIPASWLPLAPDSALIYSIHADQANPLTRTFNQLETIQPQSLQNSLTTAEEDGIKVIGERWHNIKSYGNQLLIK